MSWLYKGKDPNPSRQQGIPPLTKLIDSRSGGGGLTNQQKTSGVQGYQKYESA